MKKTNRKHKSYKKQYIIASTVCLLSAASLFAVYENNRKADLSEGYIADLTEIEESKQMAQTGEGREVTTNQAKAENFAKEDMFGWDNVMDATDEVREEEETKNPEDNVQAKVEDEPEENMETDEIALHIDDESVITADAITKPIQLSFDDSSKMLWPVSGNVILNYSMDKSVYFPTLKQYRYNPALIIETAEGTPVQAAARGQVVHIENQEETGTTLVMDLGNDYRVTYGQLKDVCVNAGKLVEAGETIGYVASPSKYYSVEGSNLYLKIVRGNQATNPMEYLE